MASIGRNLSEAIDGSKLQRFVGFGDGQTDLLVIWNGSATFNVWSISRDQAVDVFTHYGDDSGGPCTLEQAVDAITRYHFSLLDEEV